MKWIRPSRINGTVEAPASKSLMLRATAMALLSRGRSQINNPADCDDAFAGLRVAGQLGAKIERKPGFVIIEGGRPIKSTRLDCGESGLCMRMFAPISALSAERIILSGRGTLLSRPMDLVEKPLCQLGVDCRTNGGLSPIDVQGPLQSGKITVDGSLSSQFLTGLLIALPLCSGESKIVVQKLKSRPYVAMTLSLQSHFGVSLSASETLDRFIIRGHQSYSCTTCDIEGDWSGAAFLLVAGAVNGKITVLKLLPKSTQADKVILEVLDAAGAKVSTANDTVTVEKNRLQSFRFDASDSPDLFPALVALACSCQGQSVIRGVDRLKHKESNRADALLAVFSELGAKIEVSHDKITIHGARLNGGTVQSFGDHRIAMAAALAGLNSEKGTRVLGWQCVSKSYPKFFDDLSSVGGEIA
jgi:3-phosphoshikimate 1-carboxyvinyltransferase